MTVRFALDQSFPVPIVKALETYMSELELVPVGKIDHRMSTLDDWALLLALHHHKHGYEGLITTDARMLAQPKELAVLMQTKLTLVVAEGSGHDPVQATGLVLVHLPRIAKMTDRNKAQVWSFSARTPKAADPWDIFADVARRSKRSAKELYDAERLTDVELARNPLDSRRRR